MVERISALEARRRLGTLLDSVRLEGAEYIIERDGRPVAAVVPLDVYGRIHEDRAEAFDRIAAVRERLSRKIDARELEALLADKGGP